MASSYLKVGLSAVLVFVGVKMLLMDVYKVPIFVSLGVIAGILALSIIASPPETATARLSAGEGRGLKPRPPCSMPGS